MSGLDAREIGTDATAEAANKTSFYRNETKKGQTQVRMAGQTVRRLGKKMGEDYDRDIIFWVTDSSSVSD